MENDNICLHPLRKKSDGHVGWGLRTELRSYPKKYID